MDISFHYFAVKSVARAAGYDEKAAQRIAVFSQFVDDYNWFAYFRAGNIPDYIKDKKLDIVYNETLKIINPVTTGFIDYVDMATLILPRPQKYTVSAFHFIPKDRESVASEHKRAVPAALNDGSYISEMLRELRDDIASGAISENDALMKMGMLFHTFADTYAHQLFTGFNNKINSVKLIKVTDNTLTSPQNDVTEKYHYWIENWIAKIKSAIKVELPTIGHMAISHLPDLSHLRFEMEYTDYDGSLARHSRSNTDIFVDACKQLYDYMRGILGSGHPADMEWDELAEKLGAGFLIDAHEVLDNGESAAVPVLINHWKNIFPSYEYSYDSEKIKKDFVTTESGDACTVRINGTSIQLSAKNYSDDFYKFNYFADLHLIKLYGDHPRNWLSFNEAEDNAFAGLT